MNDKQYINKESLLQSRMPTAVDVTQWLSDSTTQGGGFSLSGGWNGVVYSVDCPE